MRNCVEISRNGIGAGARSGKRAVASAPVNPNKLRQRYRVLQVAATVICLGLMVADLSALTAKQMYASALAREHELRGADAHPTLKELRAAAAAYDRLVARYPTSGYADNALWQSAGLRAYAYTLFEQEADRRAAERSLAQLQKEYPTSSLVARTGEISRLLALRSARRPATAPPVPPGAIPEPPAITSRPIVEPRPIAPQPVSTTSAPATATLLSIRRTDLSTVVRITLELDGEIAYHQEEATAPPRVFFDLQNVRLGRGLSETALKFADSVIRQVRLGRRADQTTRVAMDLAGVSRYTVFTLYNPFRLVIDFERAATSPAPVVIASARPPLPVGSSPLRTTWVRLAPAFPGLTLPPAVAPPPPKTATLAPAPVDVQRPTTPLPSVPATPTMEAAPAAPGTNARGSYSLARQLGLGLSRVVIDPGHGGHDPGAQAFRVTESELVLDLALRLEKLLLKQKGLEVVMTRRTDEFIPLEERTAIANRESADLFLSIHANASENTKARGVETYYLNFAQNAEAEAVAARENSASERAIHNLPEILKAIALNDKIDESKDFAELVQRAMMRRLQPQNPALKSLGVKRAPFVVLIGAGMPSVLAEVSFVTNKQEAALLRTGAYRQRIAEALFDAVMQYQRTLKKVTAVADSSR